MKVKIVAELEERYEASDDVTSSRHFQAIYLLAKGHSTREVAEITSFGLRWIEQLLERYNAVGPAALGDLRRSNGSRPSVLKPELLERLGVKPCWRHSPKKPGPVATASSFSSSTTPVGMARPI